MSSSKEVFKKPQSPGTRAKKQETTQVKKTKKAAPVAKKSSKKEEEKESSSESEFDFENSESHEEHSGSESTDLSSSTTDSMSTTPKQPKLVMTLDSATTEKLTKKLEEKKKDPLKIKHGDPTGVVYIGHLPFGFHETQLKTFFTQFGLVTRLRLSRNKQGKSRHYAFVEFRDAIVAQVVADTMDQYLMYDRILECKVIPPEKVHPKMFATRRKSDAKEVHREKKQKKYNQLASEPKNPNKRIARQLESENRKRQKLASANIEYEFPGVAAIASEFPVDRPTRSEDAMSAD